MSDQRTKRRIEHAEKTIADGERDLKKAIREHFQFGEKVTWFHNINGEPVNGEIAGWNGVNVLVRIDIGGGASVITEQHYKNITIVEDQKEEEE